MADKPTTVTAPQFVLSDKDKEMLMHGLHLYSASLRRSIASSEGDIKALYQKKLAEVASLDSRMKGGIL